LRCLHRTGWIKTRPAQKLLARVKFTGNPYSYRTCINVNGYHWNVCDLVFTGSRIRVPELVLVSIWMHPYAMWTWHYACHNKRCDYWRPNFLATVTAVFTVKTEELWTNNCSYFKVTCTRTWLTHCSKFTDRHIFQLYISEWETDHSFSLRVHRFHITHNVLLHSKQLCQACLSTQTHTETDSDIQAEERRERHREGPTEWQTDRQQWSSTSEFTSDHGYGTTCWERSGGELLIDWAVFNVSINTV